MKKGVLALLLGLALLALAADDPGRLTGADDGATWEYYNCAAGGAWLRRVGDWRDTEGTLYGRHPDAIAVALADSSRRVLELDVLPQVTDWTARQANPAQGWIRLAAPRPSGRTIRGDCSRPMVEHRAS